MMLLEMGVASVEEQKSSVRGTMGPMTVVGVMGGKDFFFCTSSCFCSTAGSMASLNVMSFNMSNNSSKLWPLL